MGFLLPVLLDELLGLLGLLLVALPVASLGVAGAAGQVGLPQHAGVVAAGLVGRVTVFVRALVPVVLLRDRLFEGDRPGGGDRVGGQRVQQSVNGGQYPAQLVFFEAAAGCPGPRLGLGTGLGRGPQSRHRGSGVPGGRLGEGAGAPRLAGVGAHGSGPVGHSAQQFEGGLVVGDGGLVVAGGRLAVTRIDQLLGLRGSGTSDAAFGGGNQPGRLGRTGPRL
ncbi:hypothetical protein GCM10023321_70160 [Pseudonocardia eucalypti]|uniref:Secreted protein n=1 Tax=Pseudonocardia eucalypti TaxID=648755 RepID=A0ABP9R4S4_9PSEU